MQNMRHLQVDDFREASAETRRNGGIGSDPVFSGLPPLCLFSLILLFLEIAADLFVDDIALVIIVSLHA